MEESSASRRLDLGGSSSQDLSSPGIPLVQRRKFEDYSNHTNPLYPSSPQPWWPSPGYSSTTSPCPSPFPTWPSSNMAPTSPAFCDSQPDQSQLEQDQHLCQTHQLETCCCNLFMQNCLNPNSTNISIELNLRLDYILTDRSTHPTTTTTNSLVLLLTAPASQAGRLYNYTVRVQCSHCVRSTL